MKKVLVISYLFPPRGGVGVIRIAKFCKYLPEHGWRPIVLTTEAPAEMSRDAELLAEVEASSVLVRMPLPPGGRRRGFPEVSIRWRRPAIAQALRLAREEGVAAIFSSGDPVVNHLVAGEAARRSGRPWLADFRDEWAVNPEFIRSPFQRARADRWERDILEKADAVVSVTAPVVDMLVEKGGGPAAKYHLIPNGYDGAVLSALPSAPARRDRFTITFTGHLPNPADMLPVLKALRLMLSLRLAREDELLLRLVGDFEHFRHDEAMGLSGLVRKIPPGSHREALLRQQDSDLLLSVSDARRGRYAVSVKLYEYMASGRPVLAVAPAGSLMADYVARSRTGRAADPARPDEIADAIAYFFARWKRGNLAVEPDRAFLEHFDRRRTAGQLAGLLDSLAGAQSV
ncbi:MAG TPA: glycosyltransferase family 4 protein [Kiritimatiellia bacterium]|nr:glycosyltransferase family 4 protein [Kiritimatiellia bacterium]HRZ12420.1 glycosyltransferase family 4 protein [Kiritimatiellia bacterium]HSA17822.1 glycosyltransferase family 4 protein [Kiritimatiellia bacterium]